MRTLYTALVLALGMQDVPVEHADPAFRLTLPEGYELIDPKPSGSSIAYRRVSDGDPGRAILFTVSVMPGTAYCHAAPSQERLEEAWLKSLPPGATVRISEARWKEHVLTVQESHFSAQDHKIVTLMVHIPLASRPVHFTLAGVKPLEAEMRKDLERILETLEGRTNWIALNWSRVTRRNWTLYLVSILIGIDLLLLLAGYKSRAPRIYRIRSVVTAFLAVIFVLNVAFFITMFALRMLPVTPLSILLILACLVAAVISLRRVGVLARTGRENRILLEGFALLEKKLYVEALACYERGMKEFPRSMNIRNDRGIALMELGRHEEARQTFTDLLAESRLRPVNRGCALANLCHLTLLIPDRAPLLEQAERWSQDALRLMGSHPGVKSARGSLLIELGRMDEGLALLRESFSSENQLPSAKASTAAWIAIALGRQGKADEAKTFLDQARALDPQCPFLARAPQEGTPT